MKIYIVVHVTYDYYRFEDNVGVADSWLKAKDFCNEEYPNLQIYEYIIGDDEYRYLRDIEQEHLWLQKFEI